MTLKTEFCREGECPEHQRASLDLEPPYALADALRGRDTRISHGSEETYVEQGAHFPAAPLIGPGFRATPATAAPKKKEMARGTPLILRNMACSGSPSGRITRACGLPFPATSRHPLRRQREVILRVRCEGGIEAREENGSSASSGTS